jgi:hypothetical protein
MENLYYINYKNITGLEDVWSVKKVGEFDKNGDPIIYGRFKTKLEAEIFIKEQQQ